MEMYLSLKLIGAFNILTLLVNAPICFRYLVFFSCNAMSFSGCSSLSEVNLPLEKQ